MGLVRSPGFTHCLETLANNLWPNTKYVVEGWVLVDVPPKVCTKVCLEVFPTSDRVHWQKEAHTSGLPLRWFQVRSPIPGGERFGTSELHAQASSGFP